ncbi:MAG TPA: hypothetical protein VJ672_12190 [Gemmatimonadaceae bacterium]|nr:hypothetical protein [Gemmatimonadaceae bacterium]
MPNLSATRQGAAATQTGQPAQGPQSPQAPQPPIDREQLRQQIREQVEAAREAARDAAEQAREQAQIAREQSKITTVETHPVIEVPTPFGGPVIPREAVAISTAFFAMVAFIIVGWPIARAFGRRIDRKSAAPQLDTGVASQLQRIEHAVEAMAIEVERISEAQRYMARIESERGHEPSALRAGEGR